MTRKTLLVTIAVIWILDAGQVAASVMEVEFTTLGDFSTAVLDVGGISVTSPDIINVRNGGKTKGGEGLGVGEPDLLNPIPPFEDIIDRGESAKFTFASSAATNISVRFSSINFFPDRDGDGDGIPYEFAVEGYDSMFNSLGTVDLQGGDPRLQVLKSAFRLNVSSLFGEAPLSAFEFRVEDGFSVYDITYESGEVPEAASLVVWALLASTCLVAVCARRRLSGEGVYPGIECS